MKSSASEWTVAITFFLCICALMSVLDDGYEDRKLAAEATQEAIKQAKADQKAFNELARRGEFMTTFAAVSK
jgi:hypothetical protein